MKGFKIVVAIVIAVPVLFFAIGFVLPKNAHVERSIEINANEGVVFYLVSQHKQFQRWSPWAKMDPDMSVEYAGSDIGIGSMMSWTGNQEVGQGSSVYVEYFPPKRAVTSLDFRDIGGGDMGGGLASFDIESIEIDRTRVTWSFDTENNNLMEKYFGLFLDNFLGPVYAQGLEDLKKLAENLEPVVSEQIRYNVDGAEYHGYLSYPVGQLDPVPGIVIVHGVWGQTNHERSRADMLAKQGIAALAIDLYGLGSSTDDMEQAIAFMESVGENTNKTVALFDAAVEQLQNHYAVDGTRIGAIGYSVGGPIVLNMARRGKNLMGVASFYGGFGGLEPLAENAHSPTLVFNALGDAFSDTSQREAFEAEMNDSGISYAVLDYSDAQHGFSNPNADELGRKSGMRFIRYNKEADEDSWQKVVMFFEKALFN